MLRTRERHPWQWLRVFMWAPPRGTISNVRPRMVIGSTSDRSPLFSLRQGNSKLTRVQDKTSALIRGWAATFIQCHISDCECYRVLGTALLLERSAAKKTCEQWIYWVILCSSHWPWSETKRCAKYQKFLYSFQVLKDNWNSKKLDYGAAILELFVTQKTSQIKMICIWSSVSPLTSFIAFRKYQQI